MRLTCDLEIQHELRPSVSQEGTFSRQPKCKATLILGKKEDRLERRKGNTNSKVEENGESGAVYLVIQTGRNPKGVDYVIRDNIKKIYSKFISNGKATVCLKNPPHTLAISKADPSKLKTLLNILKLSHTSGGIRQEQVDLPLQSVEAGKLNLKEKDLPKSRLVIHNKSAYPLTGFPPTLEQLEAVGINLGRIDNRICHLTRLTYLDLSNNQITVIPDALKECHLRELKLSGNKIEVFPAVLCAGHFATSIKLIDLSRNGLKILPNNINNLAQLAQLKVDCNSLTRLPRNFGKLKNLQFFSASHNQLKCLPHSVSLLSLDSLDLFGNPFQQVGVLSRNGNLNLPTLKEICSKIIKKNKVPYDATTLPVVLCHYLDGAKKCLCGAACFDSYLHHMASLNLHTIAGTVTSVDKQGAMAAPVEIYLCRAKCLKLWKCSA